MSTTYYHYQHSFLQYYLEQGGKSTSHAPTTSQAQDERTVVETQVEEQIDMDIAKLVKTKQELDPDLTESTGEPIKIHIWDFAGQELYYTTHQVFELFRIFEISTFISFPTPRLDER